MSIPPVQDGNFSWIKGAQKSTFPPARSVQFPSTESARSGRMVTHHMASSAKALSVLFHEFRPFWLEKFNALSGQFSGLERELLNGRNLLKEFLLEPSSVPQNPSIPIDSIPNILLRSKLAPEVIEKVKRGGGKPDDLEAPSDPQLKLYSNALRALQDKFVIIQEDLQRTAAEHTSLLLADEIKTASGTSTPKSNGNKEEDMDALLENSIRWLYTGKQ